jgi:hypothetical protein
MSCRFRELEKGAKDDQRRETDLDLTAKDRRERKENECSIRRRRGYGEIRWAEELLFLALFGGLSRLKYEVDLVSFVFFCGELNPCLFE